MALICYGVEQFFQGDLRRLEILGLHSRILAGNAVSVRRKDLPLEMIDRQVGKCDSSEGEFA